MYWHVPAIPALLQEDGRQTGESSDNFGPVRLVCTADESNKVEGKGMRGDFPPQRSQGTYISILLCTCAHFPFSSVSPLMYVCMNRTDLKLKTQMKLKRNGRTG